ncbi:unnamed protein product [Citrullus colocynthis]|uniref:Cystatin domain-containing protein n=1 Tax=Citrullus colocynthis TaxID=252529 RepID=A0ABP0YIB0_9ROSI
MDFEVVSPIQNDVLQGHNPKSCDWEPIKNMNDPYVQEMGRFAVMEHAHKLCGVGLTFIRVVSGETMMVLEGKKYRLVVEVKEEIVVPCGPSSSIKLYVAILLDKPCHKSWKLLSFKPFGLPPFGPGPVIIHNNDS